MQRCYEIRKIRDVSTSVDMTKGGTHGRDSRSRDVSTEAALSEVEGLDMTQCAFGVETRLAPART